MTSIARTPDDRFASLPDYDHDPSYIEVTVDGTDLRLGRVDAGPADGHPVVLLHGEPTWGYLWRHVLPPLLDAGHRVVVPDLVGFGRSDKPPRDWFSYARLVDATAQHLDAAVEDTPITLVVHDWGGLVGLLWATRNRHRIARLVVCNTGLYRAGGRMSEAWWAFRNHVEKLDAFPVADMVDGACLAQLSPEVRAAYEAPFPDPSFHGGPLALPLLVPTSDDAPGAAEGIAAWEVLEAWDDPVQFIWGEQDPVLPPKIGQRMAELIPGTARFLTVQGSHFLQEDAGAEIGEHIAEFIAQH
jgi:haloalkane dehalogenase